MSTSSIAGVVEAAARVRDAGHLRAFKHAVSDFQRALGSAPDSERALTAEQARVLQALGQDVIDYIEERVPDISNAGDAQGLVSAVYEIRRLLEEAVQWRRHYAIARHV